MFKADVNFDPYHATSFKALIDAWLPLTFAVNCLNRAMGQPDLYPFVLSVPAIDKLRYVHALVGKSFGKVLPRVHRGISADEIVLPAAIRTLLIVSLKSLAIVFAVVTEDGAAAFDTAPVAHELIPIEVPNLMPEMAEECAIRLAQVNAVLLSRRVVGLCEGDSYHARVVTGHDLCVWQRIRLIGKEIEYQRFALAAGGSRQR
jgi:hypothetical protein